MNPILNQNLFIIKEPNGLLKMSNNYNVYDPNNNERIIEVKEINQNIFTKYFSFNKGHKQATPFEVIFNDKLNNQILKVKRGWVIFNSHIEVFDHDNQLVGTLIQKPMTIGGRYNIFDKENIKIGTLNIKWYSGEFSYTKDGREIAKKETNKWEKKGTKPYNVSIDPRVPKDAIERLLIMASVVL